MASKSGIFFMSGTSKQFEWVYNRYQEALQAKADSKNSKSEVLLKLDKWYQNELPKKIKSRGKESHLTHEELVQLIKWKLARGQFRPRLKDLIQMNTPRVVMQETKKAFRAIDKRKDIEAAVSALSNLKGVGPAMASAVLAAMAPELAPFMADELLLSMPEVEGLDYTMKEYMKLVEKTKECVDRLNAQGGEWTPHKVEMAVWTYYVLREFKPHVLDDLPEANAASEKRLSGAAALTTDTENGLNGEVSNGTESVSDPADEAKTDTNHTDTSPPSITETEPKVTESNGSVPPPSEPSLKEPEPEPTPTESEQAPVENGNGVTHETAPETVKRPLETDSAGDNSSDGLAEPECKRVCSEQPPEPEKTEPAAALAGNGDSMTAAAETPNGVNNTPHPITSGGD